MKAARLLLAIALGALWLYAGGAKLRDPQQFFLDVHHYELTPWDVSVLIAIYLPWLEVLTGVALLARRLALGAAAISGGMALAFLIAIASAWVR